MQDIVTDAQDRTPDAAYRATFIQNKVRSDLPITSSELVFFCMFIVNGMSASDVARHCHTASLENPGFEDYIQRLTCLDTFADEANVDNPFPESQGEEFNQQLSTVTSRLWQEVPRQPPARNFPAFPTDIAVVIDEAPEAITDSEIKKLGPVQLGEGFY